MAIDVEKIKRKLKKQNDIFESSLIALENAGQHEEAKRLRRAMACKRKDMSRLLNPPITSAETPASKLRNLLSPMYGLPDMVLAFPDRPEIREIMLDTARMAKDLQPDIHVTLKVIDELC